MFLALLLFPFATLFGRANAAGFIPGRSCGTLTPISVFDSVQDVPEDTDCALVTDDESWAEYKQAELRELILSWVPECPCTHTDAGFIAQLFRSDLQFQ